MIINGMKIKGIKRAAGESKGAVPYRFWVQINLDMDTGELLTSFHCDSGSWTIWNMRHTIPVAKTSSPMTMADIALAVDRALYERNAVLGLV